MRIPIWRKGKRPGEVETELVDFHFGDEPPEGWYAFGTHVDVPVRLEFSEKTDDALMPLWERPIPSEAGSS